MVFNVNVFVHDLSYTPFFEKWALAGMLTPFVRSTLWTGCSLKDWMGMCGDDDDERGGSRRFENRYRRGHGGIQQVGALLRPLARRLLGGITRPGQRRAFTAWRRGLIYKEE